MRIVCIMCIMIQYLHYGWMERNGFIFTIWEEERWGLDLIVTQGFHRLRCI